MGILAVDSIKSRTVAPVTVSDDLNVTGVSTVGVLTATSVVVGSAVTVNADGVITSGIVTATTFQGNFNGTTGTFSGDVSIGGTLTYEDVERVDATGLSTFREGLNVGSPTGVGGTFDPAGGLSAGIGSFSSDLNITIGKTNYNLQPGTISKVTTANGVVEYQTVTSGKEKYTLALVKELLGSIRGKYGTMPIPNGDVSLDGDTLRSEGAAERDALISELREDLESASRRNLMERQNDIANFQQETMNKMPYGIYIG